MGVAAAFEYGIGLILEVLAPAFGAAVGGTALIGLSSLLSEVARLREAMASSAVGDPPPLPR